MTSLSGGYEPGGSKLALAPFHTLQKNYGRLIAEARKEWERRFAGRDPSDACVTVRINGKHSPEFARLFPLETPLELKSFTTN